MAADRVTLARHLGFSLLSIFAGLALTPLLTFLLTRTLNLAEYGTYTILATTVSVAGVIFEFGISQYLLTKLPSMEKVRRKTYFFTILLAQLVILGVLLLCVHLPSLKQFLINLLRLGAYTKEFELTLFVAAAGVVYRIANVFVFAARELEFKAFIDIAPNLFLAISLATIFTFSRSLSVMGTLTMWLIGFLLAIGFAIGFLIVRKELDIGFSPNAVIEGYAFSLPLVPAIVGDWIVIASDRYVLNAYHGPEQVALYSLAYALVTIVATLGTTALYALYPHIAAAKNSKQDSGRLLSATVKFSLILIIPGIIVLQTFGSAVVTMVSGPKYLPAASIFPILSLFPLFLFIAFISRQHLLLANRTTTLGIVFFATAIVNLGLNFLLIPRWGMMGASFATLLSYVCLSIVLWIIVRDKIKLDIAFIQPVRILISALGPAAVFIVAGLFVDHWLLPGKIAVLLLGMVVYAAMLLLLGIVGREEFDLGRKVLQSMQKRG